MIVLLPEANTYWHDSQNCNKSKQKICTRSVQGKKVVVCRRNEAANSRVIDFPPEALNHGINGVNEATVHCITAVGLTNSVCIKNASDNDASLSKYCIVTKCICNIYL